MPPGPLPARAPSPRGQTSPGDRIQQLLDDFGPRLQAGEALRKVRKQQAGPARQASGIAAIDELLEGGFSRGELSEITGPASSGRTSLLLSLLATTTTTTTTGGRPSAGGGAELAALVDTPDAFDPPSARAAGVDLRRILWARVSPWSEAMRCTERLLETEGLPLVVLDLAQSRGPSPGARSETRIPRSAWIRLARRAAASRTALVVLGEECRAGEQARVALELQPARARFTGFPPLLEEIETRALLVRAPGAGRHRSVSVRLGPASPGAKSFG
ncbi:MAG: hypothetical protein P8Q97_08310 [Myxococcota bacterium]|jgi:hypothetical protein|nr:hypothetical protein [Myxococcota bacterium]